MSQTTAPTSPEASTLRPNRAHYRSLYPVLVTDIYPGTRLLPVRLAWLHTLAAGSFLDLIADVEQAGGELAASDMFRTTAMQSELHTRKPALANPPGFSFHEAGLAVDVDVEALIIPLTEFRMLALRRGWRGVPNESWHFEFGPPEQFGELHPCFGDSSLQEVILSAQGTHTALMSEARLA